MKTYRVTLGIVYAALHEYDVLAATPGQAEAKALEAVRDKRPDPRAEATTGGWRAAPPTGIRELGAVIGPRAVTDPTRPVEAHPDVYERGE